MSDKSATEALVQISKINSRDAKGKSFFDKMLKTSLEKYKDIQLTNEEYSKLNETLFMMKFGAGVFNPMICQNVNCPFNKICPLFKAGKAPEGEQCPLELSFIVSRAKYWSEVFITNGLDMENPLSEHYVSKLVYIDLLLQRCAWAESVEYPGMILETISKVGRGGEVQQEIIENPVVNMSDKLLNMQSKILSDLVLTPKDEYKRKAALKVKDETSDFAIIQIKKRQNVQESLRDIDVHVGLPEGGNE